MSRVKRRLAAILCADAVQYSRLMEADEDGTFDRLRGYREAIGGLVAARDGRIVNTWGDAVIVEFGSVTEAVRAAVEIQTELAGRNDALPQAERMAFRIGINLGDVLVEGGDIYGEGVNIAARLQQIAEPGGIVISAPVYEQVHARLALGFDPLGSQTVKNISDPVLSYRVRIGGANEGRHPKGQGDSFAQAGGEARPGADAQTETGDVDRPVAALVHGMKDWYFQQSGRVRFAVCWIAFFFAINVFTGLDSIWFQWPSLPFLAMLLMGAKAGKRR
ncbi:adenylate/guanylate cyclase domain-containing protein [Stappia sp. ES.058]|uniref:adenylate/guanylate cyclase domain-containing protein n=1 Tax=Stappia sp. ES.058 TaxID=1881061 RepID=UPI00087BDAED|nr:adenylate/guanylate cyclase domain-containing protein [Stappia sp. ES.058]SDU20265.1 adenylate cyclase [Stappia sp. ES.058]